MKKLVLIIVVFIVFITLGCKSNSDLEQDILDLETEIGEIENETAQDGINETAEEVNETEVEESNETNQTEINESEVLERISDEEIEQFIKIVINVDKFSPAEINILPGPVKLIIENNVSEANEVVVEGPMRSFDRVTERLNVSANGKTDYVFNAKEGEYNIYSHVPGHRRRGEFTKIRVGEYETFLEYKSPDDLKEFYIEMNATINQSNVSNATG